jgi:2-polyprenyl-3-methyl-5-hydroxy-6-metoxy-1,4-benzoquinol methylase
MKISRKLHRFYRISKNYFQARSGFLSVLYFMALGVAEKILAQNTSKKSADDLVWIEKYNILFPNNTPVAEVRTKFPVAYDSIDHISPRGAANDNTTHRPFNAALQRHFGNKKITALDLGCAGGGLVRSLIEDGHMAVGLEGSDFSKKNQLGEWKTCPLHLFTCDICEEFEILSNSGERILFDVITAWEVLEHIPENKVPGLIQNISKHLKNGGLFIASVDRTPDLNVLKGVVYHHTLQPRAWWLGHFAKENIVEINSHTFKTHEFVRGNGLGLKNWDPEIDDAFHLVLIKNI